MEDAKLRFERTPAGLYVWLELPDRDILLTKTIIENGEDADAVESFINRIMFYVYGYKRYKAALNNLLLLCEQRGVGDQITGIIRSTLDQFNDLERPGKTNKEKF